MQKLFDLFTTLVLDERNIFRYTRKFLHILFIAILSHHLYISITGPYVFLDITDYKNIVAFIVSGRIVQPLVLLGFSWLILLSIRSFILYILKYCLRNWFEVQILKHNYFNREINGKGLSLSSATDKNWLVQLAIAVVLLFEAIETQIISKIIEMRTLKRTRGELYSLLAEDEHIFENALSKYAARLNSHILLLITLMLLIILVQLTIAIFSWWLLSIALFLIFLTIVIFCIIYRLIVVFPSAVCNFYRQRQLHSDMTVINPFNRLSILNKIPDTVL